jgi:ABC-type lipoprotein release transport system permease subunit
LFTALSTSVVFTLLPARRAARLDPVLALSRR